MPEVHSRHAHRSAPMVHVADAAESPNVWKTVLRELVADAADGILGFVVAELVHEVCKRWRYCRWGACLAPHPGLRPYCPPSRAFFGAPRGASSTTARGCFSIPPTFLPLLALLVRPWISSTRAARGAVAVGAAAGADGAARVALLMSTPVLRPTSGVMTGSTSNRGSVSAQRQH